jgi:hypothetical protein
MKPFDMAFQQDNQGLGFIANSGTNTHCKQASTQVVSNMTWDAQQMVCLCV